MTKTDLLRLYRSPVARHECTEQSLYNLPASSNTTKTTTTRPSPLLG
jgi:hypothetical protein